MFPELSWCLTCSVYRVARTSGMWQSVRCRECLQLAERRLSILSAYAIVTNASRPESNRIREYSVSHHRGLAPVRYTT
jgi:hypothetical protein